MSIRIWLALGCLWLLAGCAPKIRTALTGPAATPLAPTAQVLVLSPGTPVPKACTPVGTLRIGEAGATINCGLERVVELARTTARRLGANVVELTEIRPPGFSSSCYQLTANLFLARNIEAAAQRLRATQDSLQQPSLLPANATHSVLYAYRPRNQFGSFLGFDLYLNDSIVAHLGNSSRFQMNLPTSGRITLSTKGKQATEIIIDLEAGREYFLCCGIVPGPVVGKSFMELMRPALGRVEYNAIASKK